MNLEDILYKVKENTYKIVDQEKGRGRIWNVFGRIKKDDGAIIENLACCKKCGKILKTTKSETANLHKHKCFREYKNRPEIKGPEMESLINELKKAMTTSKTEVLHSLCRTCMRGYQSDILLISMYDDYKGKDNSSMKIMDLLHDICPQLTICTDDNLPKKICKSCLDLLGKILEFRKNSLNIEQQFREMIGEHSDPFQEIDDNSSIQKNESSEISVAPKINAINPSKAVFRVIKKNGQFFEVYNDWEECDETSGDSDGSFTENEVHINTSTNFEQDCGDLENQNDDNEANFVAQPVHLIKGGEKTNNGNICPINIHEKNKTKIRHKCQFCNKVYRQSVALRYHERTHTGERPYLCSICGKAFSNQWGLKEHNFRHGREFNYQCSLCPKKFRNSSGASAHKANVHSTARPHVCDVCGSSFKKPYTLKKHKNIHGEKKYKCDFCESRFSQAFQCRRHMRTHTGEKPYKCKYCERAFMQSNDMIKHLRSHVGENVYRCEMCPQAFRLLCELRTHFASHKDDDEETKLKNLEALKKEEELLQIKIESEKAK